MKAEAENFVLNVANNRAWAIWAVSLCPRAGKSTRLNSLTLSPFFGQIWGLLKVDLRPAVSNHVSGFYTELPSFP
jgi:hypothetical protein